MAPAGRLRPASRNSGAPLAAQAAAQFRHALAGTWCGPAVGAVDVGPRRYFDDTDLYARDGGARVTGVLCSPSARVKARSTTALEDTTIGIHAMESKETS